MGKRFSHTLLVAAVVFFLAGNIFAQDKTLGSAPFHKGALIGQVGIGFGLAGIYGTTSVPPITAGLQYGIEDKISVGGLVGFSTSSYEFWSGFSGTYTYFLIGARGEYHFLENSDNMDAYAGLTLGYNVVSWSASGNAGNVYNWTAGDSYAVFGFHGGLRYWFNPNIGVFGELGYGLGFLTFGASFKL